MEKGPEHPLVADGTIIAYKIHVCTIKNNRVKFLAAIGTFKPIERWVRAMRLPLTSAAEELRTAYREYWPTQGELIFTGACDFHCQHCVYPPAFARLNRDISAVEWDRILMDINKNLEIKTFVYGGRSASLAGLEVLVRLRKQVPEALIGLIDNGISLIHCRDRLSNVSPDWIDISLDGKELEHDLQRNRRGSFRAGLEGALWLVRNGVTPKVNILTCLTTLNKCSVVPMILELNRMGFKNFFISPVALAEGARPSPNLRVSGEEFVGLIRELYSFLPQLDDAWVEINLFSAAYAEYMARLLPDIWSRLVFERDSLFWHKSSPRTGNRSGSELFLRYCPTSLTGTREFIVNTNGDVIMPKSMAAGWIAKEHIAGNLLLQNALEIVEGFSESTTFNFCIKEFLHERDLLRRYL